MKRYIRKRHQKLGLPPGSLVFVGEDKAHPATLHVFDFDEQNLREDPNATIEAVLPLKDTRTTSWIDISAVHDVDLVERLGTHFGIHPLVLEDIVTTGQRPKLEEYDAYLVLILHMLSFDPEKRRVQSEQVSLLIGPTWLLSFQEIPGDVFEPVRNRLRSGQGRIRKQGSAFLAYALLDVIIDHYFSITEAFSDLIEATEDQVVEEAEPMLHRQINNLRRELITVRRAVWPVREMLSRLERSESDLLDPGLKLYLRDAYDHTVQVIDIVESLRDVLGGLMDLYMSSLSQRMNEIMKFLTVIGTIFLPLTFIAGVYGMNFAHMPELNWRYGYPLAWLVMLLVAIGMVVYFKQRRWL